MCLIAYKVLLHTNTIQELFEQLISSSAAHLLSHKYFLDTKTSSRKSNWN